jgi:transposase
MLCLCRPPIVSKMRSKSVISNKSEENYSYLESKGLTSYIKPQSYERSKTRRFKEDFSKRENMQYDPQLDEYTCHNQKKLRKTKVTYRTSATGHRSEITVYECEVCSDCPFKERCTRAKGNRRLMVPKRFIEQRQKSLENISTDKGIRLRVNRSIQVEGAFGVLKTDYGFTRFLTRGKTSVTVNSCFCALAAISTSCMPRYRAGEPEWRYTL